MSARAVRPREEPSVPAPELVRAFREHFRDVFGGMECGRDAADEMVRRMKPLILRAEPACLTPRQKQCLEAIRGLQEETGITPSLQELAERLGCKLTSAHDLVWHLVAKGVVRRNARKGRSLEIVGEGT